jgi:ribulose-phosphate 3-epimerase
MPPADRPASPSPAAHPRPGARRRVEIAPSILSADFARLADDIRLVESAGADLLHLDVMDGHFVPNITFGPLVVDAVNRISDLFLDVHLMIADPARYAERFVKAGADRLLVHVEVLPDPKPLLAEIRVLGCQAGLALNPETPFEAVEPFLGDIDLLLVMSVHPGFGGQKFLPDVLRKVERAVAVRARAGASFAIEIDGGIDAVTAGPAARAGVEVFVAGNAIYSSPEPAAALHGIRRAAEDGAKGGPI